MNYTLIITHGRTGSTLLQGILNAIEGWHIKGENFNFPYGLYLSYQALIKSCGFKDKGDPSSPTNPWFGVGDYNLEDYSQQVRSLIENILLSGQANKTITNCGFKEIRYFDLFKNDPSGETLSGYLDFLTKILHPCKLVILQRNLKDVIKSDWWAEEDKESMLKLLSAFNDFLLSYSQKNKDITFCIDYENMISKGKKLNQLFKFLDAAPTDSDLNKVLMTKHSYNIRSLIPFSVPTSSKGHPEILTKANQLHINQKFEQAKEAYTDYVEQYEQGNFKRLPFYVGVRAERQAYMVRTSPTHKIAYFPIPKCACSSISQLLYQVINNKPFTEDTTDDASINIHNYFDAGSSELSLNKYSDFFKFTVIRDPIERFVSGFRNRILHHGDLDPVLQSMHIWKRPDINEFAMNLEDYMLRALQVEVHFQPVCLRLGNSLDNLDKVIPIEDIKNVPAMLSSITGQELQLPHVQTGGPKKNIHELSESSLEKLIEFYRQDYELLADYYSPERIRKLHAIKPNQGISLSMNISY